MPLMEATAEPEATVYDPRMALWLANASVVRTKWGATMAAVADGEHYALLRNGQMVAAVVAPDWYARAARKAGHPAPSRRQVVGSEAVRTKWSAVLDDVFERSNHIEVVRRSRLLVHIVPAAWFAKASEALGEAVIRV